MLQRFNPSNVTFGSTKDLVWYSIQELTFHRYTTSIIESHRCSNTSRTWYSKVNGTLKRYIVLFEIVRVNKKKKKSIKETNCLASNRPTCIYLSYGSAVKIFESRGIGKSLPSGVVGISCSWIQFSTLLRSRHLCQVLKLANGSGVWVTHSWGIIPTSALHMIFWRKISTQCSVDLNQLRNSPWALWDTLRRCILTVNGLSVKTGACCSGKSGLL